MKISRKIGILVIAALLAMPALSAPAAPESIKALMHKTGAGDMSIQMMNQLIPSLKKMIPDAPESFWSDVMSEYDPDEMINIIIPVYQKHLSEEDIKEINTFYDSPAGKKLIHVQPAIMQESMLLGQQYGESVARKILNKYSAMVENEVKK